LIIKKLGRQKFQNILRPWVERGFIEKIPEPLNSAVLEETDLSYFYEKGGENNYHLKEARDILNYFRKSVKKF
jgi:hypothetical protein